MNRTWLLLLIMACSLLTFAQGGPPAPNQGARYQPIAPPPTTTVYGGGGWGGGYGGASTAAGSAMNGMSQVISAAGQYNLSTSAAAINMTVAESNALQNQVQACNTFWELRNTGRAQRAAERGPRPTAEQIARMAHSGIPRPLSPSQMDPVSGTLNWPGPLQDDSFGARRGEVQATVSKWVKYGVLDYAEKTEVGKSLSIMFKGLKAQIRDIPPQDYATCRTFLQSLNYAVTRTCLQ